MNNDFSINENDLIKLKKKIDSNPKFIETLIETNISLDVGISVFSELKEDGEGDLINVKQYLINHPEILEKHKEIISERWTLEWPERIRWSVETEVKFLNQAREINKGYYGEIIQFIYRLTNNKLVKFYAISGCADQVMQKDIDESLKNSVIYESNLKEIIIAHNHSNYYQNTKVRSRTGEYIGFLTNNSLSERDVKFADDFHNKLRIPVTMIAISEIGLTYEYTAGTSRKRNY